LPIRGCLEPELAEFYANCEVTNGIVTSSVHGRELHFDVDNLGAWLGVPSKGFDVYIREDKTVLSNDHLLDLTRKLAQQPDLSACRSVRKGEIQLLHRLLFWFVIKNVIPREQGCNLADSMDMYLTDLLDLGEPINLPAIMISHIGRIANTSKSHDLGYGLLLTSVFETLGIPLQKRMRF